MHLKAGRAPDFFYVEVDSLSTRIIMQIPIVGHLDKSVRQCWKYPDLNQCISSVIRPIEILVK